MVVRTDMRGTCTLAAPPARVFDFLADSENDPTWCPAVEDTRRTHGEAGVPGSRYTFRQGLGRGRAQTMELVLEAAERPHLLVWTCDNATMQYRSEVLLAPHGSGTRLMQHNSNRFLPVPWILGPFVRRAVRRGMRRQFRALADALEA